MYTLVVILILIVSVLLGLIVLVQNSKGGGLAANFAAGNQTFGVRQTTDILEKITWGLVVFIFVVSIATSFTTGSSKSVNFSERAESELTEDVAFPTPEVESPADTLAE